MVFSSEVFIFLFLPLVLFSVFIAPPKYRNIVLLFFSLFFYFWGEGWYISIMILSIIINYLSGLVLEPNTLSSFKSKIPLFLVIFFNLGILGYFKYGNFIIENIEVLSGIKIAIEHIHLPIGISFFTFQGISYAMDVYRNEAKYQKNFLNVGLYISLFPQLIAGPIVRYNTIANQLKSRKTSSDGIRLGLERFIWGLGKKVIIANQLGAFVDTVFAQDPSTLPPGVSWLGIILYSLQLYYDFSGYSDMAIGLGKIFGFTFPENFNYPYISKSVKEFWRRWHISLSSWFKDYLYIPLGGNRNGRLRTTRNLLIVFFLTGLWHGASWNFVIWGLFHGIFLILERGRFNKIISNRGIGMLYALFVVINGWVLFRSPDIGYAISYFKNMYGFSHGSNFLVLTHLDYWTLFILVISVVFCAPVFPFIKNYINQQLNSNENILLSFSIIRSTIVIIIFIVSVMIIQSSDYNPFIYFRF